MKTILFFLLCIINISVFATDLGETTYQVACQNCHAPELAKRMNAPAAFDKKAWAIRFKQAKMEAKKNPTRFKTEMDYILYRVNIGKGLMPHGGLCKESDLPDDNCSKEALAQAIHYMAQTK
jgi:cytochrome c5